MRPRQEAEIKYYRNSREGKAATCCHEVDKKTGAYLLRCVRCGRGMGISRVALGVIWCAECLASRIATRRAA
jgi:hypothetical protein